MKPPTPPERGDPPRWSPETETREEMKALLLVRRPLTSPEAVLFRHLCVDIYDAYFDNVWHTLRKWRVPDDLLEELTQETFMRLWDTTVAEGLPDVLLAKLRGLAMGLAWNLRRRERRSPVTDRGIPSSGSEKPVASVPQIDRALDLKDVVRKLFHELSPQQRRVVDAVVFRDLTHGEAAHELGIGKSTVANGWRSARSWRSSRRGGRRCGDGTRCRPRGRSARWRSTGETRRGGTRSSRLYRTSRPSCAAGCSGSGRRC